ncbi:MAG: hypothetical protein EA353_11830 [Puniceicoccaceae bacterium]|nr:MAG: hypothetical protein EA353_11830 [Puniceicoccaceae bacterium]
MPILTLLGRWMRWILFGALFAYFLKLFELSFRPDWVHFVSGLALWFVLETGYNWIVIKALSRSDLPLFPEFKENTHGDEWPAETRFIEIKDWLRERGFKRLKALKAELFEDTYLRASVYESPDRETRIQILFFPKSTGGTTACFTITSLAESGERLITDNLFLPYGGYYPENWSISRRPLVGSLPGLLHLHGRRIVRHSIEPIVMEEDALEELNEQQRILERLNTETGFLVPRQRREEDGKITAEGRYRLWKEMWSLAYLAKSVA